MFIGTVGSPNEHDIKFEKYIDLRLMSAKLNSNEIT